MATNNFIFGDFSGGGIKKIKTQKINILKRVVYRNKRA